MTLSRLIQIQNTTLRHHSLSLHAAAVAPYNEYFRVDCCLAEPRATKRDEAPALRSQPCNPQAQQSTGWTKDVGLPRDVALVALSSLQPLFSISPTYTR